LSKIIWQLLAESGEDSERYPYTVVPLRAGISPCLLQAQNPQVLCYAMANSYLEIRLVGL